MEGRAGRAQATPTLIRAKQLELLLEIDQLSTADAGELTLMQAMARLLAREVCDFCVIHFADDAPPSMVRLATAAAEEKPAALLLRLQQLRPVSLQSRPIPAQAFRSRAPVLVEEVTDDVLVQNTPPGEQREIWRALAPKSSITAPIEVGGRTYGVIVLLRARAPGFREADLPLARLIAGRAALLLDNVRMRRALAAHEDENQAREQALLADLPDLFIRLSAQDRILAVKPSPTFSLYGCPRSALDQKVLETLPAEVLCAGFAEALAVARTSQQEQTCEYQTLQAGRSRLFQARITTIGRDGEALVAISDVTERRRAEADTSLRQALTAAAYEAPDSATALGELCRIVCEQAGFAAAQTWWLRKDRLETSPRSSHGPDRSRLYGANEECLRRGEGLAGRAWELGGPARVMDLASAPDFVGRQAALEAGMVTGLAIPVISNGEVHAVVELYRRQANAEDDRLQGMITRVLVDVVARRMLQERLLVLERAVQELDEAVFIVKTSPMEREMPQIAFVNRAFERLMGYQSAEAIGMPATLLRGPSTDETVVAELSRRLLSRQSFFGELVVSRKNGVEIDVEVAMAAITEEDGRIGHTIGLLRDVSERKLLQRTERELQRALRKAMVEWRSTFDALELPIFVVDPSGRVLRANDAGRQLVGVPFGQLINAQLERVTDATEPWSSATRLARQAAEDGRPASVQVADVMTRRTYELSASLQHQLDDGDRDGVRVTLIVRDVSKMIELQENLRISETMSAMGSLVAGVAHEVRNPLFGISGTLDAFEARFGEQEQFQRYLIVLRGEVDKLGHLLRELLEYGSTPELELRNVPLGEVIASVARSTAAQAEEAQVAVELALPEWLPALRMDPLRIGQVFQNLVQNAIQHTPPGGRVTIGAEVRRHEGEARVVATVRDTGSGFAPRDLPRIFTPFFTRRRGGTGLGLSIVQRIVERHGGRVRIGNRQEGGAIASVELPLPERS